MASTVFLLFGSSAEEGDAGVIAFQSDPTISLCLGVGDLGWGLHLPALRGIKVGCRFRPVVAVAQ